MGLCLEKEDRLCGFGQGTDSPPEIPVQVGHSALLQASVLTVAGFPSSPLTTGVVATSDLLSSQGVLPRAESLALIASLNSPSAPTWGLLSPPSFTEEETSSHRQSPSCQIGCGIWPPGRMQPPLRSLLWPGVGSVCVPPSICWGHAECLPPFLSVDWMAGIGGSGRTGTRVRASSLQAPQHGCPWSWQLCYATMIKHHLAACCPSIVMLTEALHIPIVLEELLRSPQSYGDMMLACS